MNTTPLKIMATAGLVALLTTQETKAQNGMDRAGIGTGRYARLHRANNPLQENNQNEKALGVYTNDFNPSSMLEINTTINYTPFLHPNFSGDRGRVFKTVAPAGFTQQWQMFKANNQIFRLFNTAVNNDFQLEATQPTAKILLNTGGPTPSTIRERIRIMQGIGFGGVTNVTRVGINYGATPIGIPVAMLHLGNSFNIANATRTWMDVGTFYNLQSDHMYVGLKDEGGSIGDRMDAVINWGNNFIDTPTGHGPDNLRFIFNAGIQLASTDPRESQNGLEVARMEPTLATTLTAPNYGMMGIGNFSPTGPNTATADVVDAKLDIDGDLRIREVTQDNTLTQILAIDPTDKNRVHWVDASSFTGGGGGTVTADNGLSIFPANNVQLGSNVGLTTAQLLNDREIPMNENNLFFSDPAIISTNNNRVELGTFSSTFPIVHSKFTSSNNLPTILPTGPASKIIGITGATTTQLPVTLPLAAFPLYINNIANTMRIGVLALGIETPASTTPAQFSIGTSSFGGGGPSTQGVYGTLSKALSNNPNGNSFGVASICTGQGNLTAVSGSAGAGTANPGTRVGVGGFATGGTLNYGIVGSVVGVAGTDFAGFFNGNIACTTGGSLCPSDANMKTNIQPLSNATSIISQLLPKTFDFNVASYPSINLPTETGLMGLIAQDVELILPNLVSEATRPEVLDSNGNVLYAAVTFKAMKYEGFIPLLIAGFNEQQTKLDSVNTLVATQDSINQNLQTRLAALEACINNVGICNNHGNNNNNRANTQTLTLQNLNAIILDQNLPNPFAESTQINYVIPTDVQKATLLFYDMNGRIINEVNINERGNGTLTVYGENLEKGIYTYSLLADGKLIATKKMVKQ